MKNLVILLAIVALVSAVAEEVNAEALQKLQLSHQKAIQSFGDLSLRAGNFSFSVVGNDLVSVVKGEGEMSFYMEKEGKKLYTHLQIQAGERNSEVSFVFDNKLTVDGVTKNVKYTMNYSFGDKVGFIIVTEAGRWDLQKCWNCIKCAGENIWELYGAYKECGTNWQCWITKYQTLISLYQCVKDNCVGCFAN